MSLSNRQTEIFVQKLAKQVTDLSGEVMTLKGIIAANNIVSGGDATVGGDLAVTGTSTLDGGLVTYAADDSGGAGFRTVLVPNA